MIQINKNSRLEVWSDQYINYPDNRSKKDINSKIIQIEPTTNNTDYLVEVLDEPYIDNNDGR